MVSQKLSRKEMKRRMKEDEFASSIDKLLKWAEKHKGPVIGGFIAIFMIAGIYVSTKAFIESKVNRSEQMLASAVEIVQYRAKKGEVSKYPTKDEQLKAALESFENIMKENVTESVKERASYYIATTYLELGEDEKALAQLDTLYESSDYPIKALVAVRYAGILEEKGDLKKALDVFNGLKSKDMTEVVTLDFVTLSKAKILIRMDKQTEAETELNKLIKDFPESPYVKQAEAELEKLNS